MNRETWLRQAYEAAKRAAECLQDGVATGMARVKLLEALEALDKATTQ